MSLNHTLLGLLLYEPMTGYQLKQCFDNSIYYFWNAQISQIYREVGSMEEKGLITSCIEPQEGKAYKKIYSVTVAGSENFMEWLRNFLDTEETVCNEFSVRIYFSAKLDLIDVAYEFKQFIRKQEATIANFRKIEADIKHRQEKNSKESLFWYMSLRKGIKSVETAIEWAEECLQLIHEMESDK